MTTIENPIFSCQIDPNTGTFSIYTKEARLPNLVGARLSIAYSKDGKHFVMPLRDWSAAESKSVIMHTEEHGDIETRKFTFNADENGVAGKLKFGIIQEYPLVIWNLEIQNQGDAPIQVEALNLLDLDAWQGGRIEWTSTVRQEQLGFFSNGWQSWSPSRAYRADQKMKVSHLGGLQLPMTRNPGTPLPRKAGVFSSDFFAVLGDHQARTGFLVGSLSQKNHFTSILADFNEPFHLQMWANGDNARLDPGGVMTTDWAVFNPVLLDHREPLEKYFEAVSREHHLDFPEESSVGWCSWYHFYTKISEPIIRENLETIVEQQETLPVQLVQIDDGFESQIGDWFTFKPEFPTGVAPLAAEITREGLLPGLWLAPFILHPKAEIIRQHPDWVLRKPNSKRVNAGYVWGALTTALDLTVPEALDYACSVVKTASTEWGYPYLKLDFLYAAAVDCQYRDQTLTRAQVLRRGLEALRAAVGKDVTLLGCGAPFGSSLGLFEAMRIGPDVSGDWLPKFQGIGLFIKEEPAFPSARNSIANILTRANLHRHWWVNDPDCLLVRPDTRMSLAEVQTLATTIALTGGSLLVSDDLPRLPRERLKIAECLLPVIGDRARVMDWFDAEYPSRLRVDQVNTTGEWHILAEINWEDRPADVGIALSDFALPDGEYWVSEFWSGKTARLKAAEEFVARQVPAHGCVVLAVRKADGKRALYLGSDLHIAQGIEVAEWKQTGTGVEATLRLPRKAEGSVRVWLPGKVKSLRMNDTSLNIVQHEKGVLTIPVVVDGFAHLEIEY